VEFKPDLTVDSSRYRAVGTFHTHPTHDKFEQGGLGNDSFSGGDLKWAFENLKGVHIAQGAQTQFMVAFTAETPANIDTAEIKRDAHQRLNELTSSAG